MFLEPVCMPLTTLPIEICVLIVQFLPNLDHQVITGRIQDLLTTPPGVEALQIDLALADDEDGWSKSISPQRS